MGRVPGGLLAASFRKQREDRVSCNDTTSYLDFEFSMINNLDIDSVSGYLTHTPYWIGLCHVQGYLRGWSDDFWPLGLLAAVGMFCGFGQAYLSSYHNGWETGVPQWLSCKSAEVNLREIVL